MVVSCSSPIPKSTAVDFAGSIGIDLRPSTLVGIDDSQIRRIAEDLNAEAIVPTEAGWDDESFWNVEASRADRSQFLAVGNAINFRFWSLHSGRFVPARGVVDGQSLRGAMYMWRCLRRAWDTDRTFFDADYLTDLAPETFDRVFADDTGQNPLGVALGERVANLRDLGQALAERHAGRFVNVIDATTGSLEEFVRASTEFRAYDDPLCKLTMVNAIMHSGSRLVRFDQEALPAMDYHLVRHALRQRMIEPAPALAAKLREGELLSPEEGLELRRVALRAFLELSVVSGVAGEALDNRYWLNRVNCTDADPVCSVAATASVCPFSNACARKVDYGFPLELTRYY